MEKFPPDYSVVDVVSVKISCVKPMKAYEGHIDLIYHSETSWMLLGGK